LSGHAKSQKNELQGALSILLVLGTGKRTRRFIAWHESPHKFAHLMEILNIVKAGFDSLTEMVQGPCYENQVRGSDRFMAVVGKP